MTRHAKKQCGFSVVELAIVMAIIVLLVAIAVPRMFQARVRANDASAEASIHAINVAQATYFNSYPRVGYANSLDRLGGHSTNCDTVNAANACLIDSQLASGTKGGYLFELLGDGNVPDTSYLLTAIPEAVGTTGSCAFSSSQTGAVHAGTPAVSSSSSRSAGLAGGACGIAAN